MRAGCHVNKNSQRPNLRVQKLAPQPFAHGDAAAHVTALPAPAWALRARSCCNGTDWWASKYATAVEWIQQKTYVEGVRQRR